MNNTASTKKKINLLDPGSIVLSSDRFYKLLLALLWINHGLYSLFYRVLLRIPFVNYVADSVFGVLCLVLLVGALPYILKKTRPVEILVYTGLLLSVSCTILFGSETVEGALINELSRVLIETAPFIFIGSALVLENNEKLLNILSWANVITHIILQFYYLNQPEGLESYNMSAAYYILPSIAFVIYYAITNKGWFNWVGVAASILLLLSYGTRGPLLCVIIFVIGVLVYKMFSIKSIALRSFFLLILGVVLYFVVFTDIINELFYFLDELFTELGFSTRIFKMFLEESITDDSGRAIIANRVLQGVSENALFGYGVMGDRNFVPTYAHNVLYELWCSFGVIIGTLLFAAVIILPVYAIIKTKNTKERLFLWMLMSITIVKLFMSSSYLYETTLFMMIGYSLAVIRNTKNTDTTVSENGEDKR